MNSCLKYKRNEIPYPECNPHTLGVVKHQPEKTLNEHNLHEITLVQRPVEDKRTDYDSTFSKHNKEHNRFYSMTSN